MAHGSSSERNLQEQLSNLGIVGYEDLILSIPSSIPSTLDRSLESRRERVALASEEDAPVYLGAGFYDHFISSSIDHFVSQVEFHRLNSSLGRPICSELVRALTSFQVVARRLTGFDAVSASIYASGSALASACLCAVEFFAEIEPQRRLILIPEALAPKALRALRGCVDAGFFETYQIASFDGVTDLDALNRILASEGRRVAGTVVPYPNFYGLLGRVGQEASLTRRVGGFAIMAADPIALAVLRSPAEWDADLVACDSHMTPLFSGDGGARLGVVAASQRFLAAAPSSLVTSLVNEDGETSFQLSRTFLHKHSSVSPSWSQKRFKGALRTLGRLAFAEPRELRSLAKESRRIAQYGHEALERAGFELLYKAPFLREFVVRVEEPTRMLDYLERWGIIGGYSVSNGILLAFTEKRSVDEVDELVYFMSAFRDGAR